MTHETQDGYTARDTIGGIEVYDWNDILVCKLSGRTLNDYMNEHEEVDDDALEEDIKDELDVENFIAYQEDYC